MAHSTELKELKAGEVSVDRSSPRRGAVGVVYPAQLQIGPNQWITVALKALLPENTTTGALASLRAESALLLQAQSAHVVKSYGHVVIDKEHFIAMEWLDESLSEALQRLKSGDFDWTRRATVALHLARALHAIHSKNLIHGDVKADNVLLGRDGVAKLSDFGLARIRVNANTHSSSEQPIGSPLWRAPEVEFCQPPRQYADMFGFGVILWALGSGRPPSAPHREESNLPFDFTCPTKLQRLMEKCLIIDEPSQRATAELAIKELETHLSSSQPQRMREAALPGASHLPAANASQNAAIWEFLMDLLQTKGLQSIYPPFGTVQLNWRQLAAVKAFQAAPGDLKLFASFASMIPRHQVALSTFLPTSGRKDLSGMEIIGEVLRLDPRLAVAYRLLAEYLYSDSETTPSNFPSQARGRNREWLLEESLRLDRSDPLALARLARVKKGSVGIQLALEALRLDSKCSVAYVSLGVICRPEDRIQLGDGRSLTKQELHIEGIKSDPTNSNAYHNLGTTLRQVESIALSDGRRFTKQQLYLEAIKLDPDFGFTYYNLGTTLPSKGSIALYDGRKLTERELFIEAIKLNPTYSPAYTSLANLLPPGGSVSLMDGRKLTKDELLIEARQCQVRSSPLELFGR